MFKLNFHHFRQSILSLTLIFNATLFITINSSVNPVSGQIIAEQSTNWIAWIWRRKPKRPLGSRSGNNQTCLIAPGLIDTNIVWNNRPLFLWQYSGDNKSVDLIVREYDSKKDVWIQSVNLVDEKVFYSGEKALEPGKMYQWKLSENSNWALFKIMSADERKNVEKQLQNLEQQSEDTKNSSEAIALKKAELFLNYEVKHQANNKTFNAWSDALLALYQVDNPSDSFIDNRKKFVESLCPSMSSSKSEK